MLSGYPLRLNLNVANGNVEKILEASACRTKGLPCWTILATLWHSVNTLLFRFKGLYLTCRNSKLLQTEKSKIETTYLINNVKQLPDTLLHTEYQSSLVQVSLDKFTLMEGPLQAQYCHNPIIKSFQVMAHHAFLRIIKCNILPFTCSILLADLLQFCVEQLQTIKFYLFIYFIIALWQVCQGSASDQCLEPNTQMYDYLYNDKFSQQFENLLVEDAHDICYMGKGSGKCKDCHHQSCPQNDSTCELLVWLYLHS